LTRFVPFADSANLTSVFAADAQMMTGMLLSVRNNGRQFLEVQLSVNATVCSASVDAQPVRPGLRDGKISSAHLNLPTLATVPCW
jgi:hypothetical protein